MRAAGLAGAQVQHARPARGLPADEIQTFEQPDAVAQIGQLAQPLSAEMNEHEVRSGCEPDDRAGFTAVAGEDVGHVRSVRSRVRRIAAGRVVAERSGRVGFPQRCIDHLARVQPADVTAPAQADARAALIPQAHEARGAVGMRKFA